MVKKEKNQQSSKFCKLKMSDMKKKKKREASHTSALSLPMETKFPVKYEKSEVCSICFVCFGVFFVKSDEHLK